MARVWGQSQWGPGAVNSDLPAWWGVRGEKAQAFCLFCIQIRPKFKE